MTSRQRAQLLWIASLMLYLAAVSQAQQYTMKALGVGIPDAQFNNNNPRINNNGQVVVSRSNGGYLYSGGSLTLLPYGLYALDINNHSVIALYNANTVVDGELGTPPFTNLVDIGTLPPVCGPGSEFITSLNDNQVAVGVANAPTSCPTAFIFSNSKIAPLSGRAQWLAINNSNQVVGFMENSAGFTRAIQLTNGVLTDLDPANANVYNSEAMGINDNGEFVINSDEAICTKRLGPPSFKTINFVCQGTNWNPIVFNGSTATTLPGLGPYGALASAINFFGDVVGSSQTSTGAQHAFVNFSGASIDINGRVSNAAGWTFSQAYDINDNGQIVALGLNSGNGNYDVVVLTPQIVKQPPPVRLSVTRTDRQVGVAAINSSIGTVTLASAAPAGGTIVYLSSSNPLVKVPAKIRIAPKSKNGTFPIATSRMAGSADVTFSATTGADSKATTLTIAGGGK